MGEYVVGCKSRSGSWWQRAPQLTVAKFQLSAQALILGICPESPRSLLCPLPGSGALNVYRLLIRRQYTLTSSGICYGSFTWATTSVWRSSSTSPPPWKLFLILETHRALGDRRSGPPLGDIESGARPPQNSTPIGLEYVSSYIRWYRANVG